MSTYKLLDFVKPIAVNVQNPANSGYERFVGLEHYDSGEFVVRRYSGVELLTTNAKAFQKNDILIARRNVYLRRAGVVFFDGITSGDSIVLRVKRDCEIATGINYELAQKILPLILNTDNFWLYANKHADGMNSKRISKDMLIDYEFALPSSDELQIWADKLWTAHYLKESYQQLLPTIDDMLKAKFTNMFGDVDNPINGTQFENVFEIKDNLRKPLNEIARGEMRSGDVLYPYYGATGLVDKINQYMIDMEAICLAEDCGDFAAGGDSAYIISGKSWVNNHAHILVPKENCRIKYAQTLFKIMDLGKYVDNDNRQKLTQTNMKKIKILLPSLDDQDKFVAIATQAEATKASLRQSIESIDRVIRSLINQ